MRGEAELAAPVGALSYHFLLSDVLVVLSSQLHLNFAFLSQPQTPPQIF